MSKSPVEGVGVHLSFERGWADLEVVTGHGTFNARATNITDAFVELVDACAQLSNGRFCVSSFWGGEPGGVFFDFFLDGNGRLALAVHEALNPDWLGGPVAWIPARATLRFTAAMDFGVFVREVARELHRIRRNDVDGSGYMPQWGWSFPEKEYRLIEHCAVRNGYRPEPA